MVRMNLRRTVRRASPGGVVVLLAGGLLALATSQAPPTREAALDVPAMFRPVRALTALRAPAAATTTTTAPAPIVYDATPPGGRPNVGGDVHPMVPHAAFGMIVIPKINLVHPIFEGIDESTIHWGPGHWPGSALPGQRGNTVFAGHRVTHTHPFRNIDQLVPGDLIQFVMPDGTYTYKMTSQQIVNPSDTWIVNPTPDATLTLFACHPPGFATHRIVVKGVYVGKS